MYDKYVECVRKAMNNKDRIADLCHWQWSGWMHYFFSKCREGPDGVLVIPRWAVERWRRQADTAFSDLSEDEKDSDRKEAQKFIDLFSTLSEF